MNTRKPRTLREIEGKVANKPEGLREEYCWLHLREMFPGAADEALSRWAGMIEKQVGGF